MSSDKLTCSIATEMGLHNSFLSNLLMSRSFLKFSIFAKQETDTMTETSVADAERMRIDSTKPTSDTKPTSSSSNDEKNVSEHADDPWDLIDEDDVVVKWAGAVLWYNI